MKQTIFGIILGLLLVLSVSVGFEVQEKYEIKTASDYVASTEFSYDIDGIRYGKGI